LLCGATGMWQVECPYTDEPHSIKCWGVSRFDS
jgi:hypothetical protein